MGWHQTFIIPCQLHGSRIIEHDGENMWVGDGERTAIMMNSNHQYFSSAPDFEEKHLQ